MRRILGITSPAAKTRCPHLSHRQLLIRGSFKMKH
jgi:hypothetical protein